MSKLAVSMSFIKFFFSKKKYLQLKNRIYLQILEYHFSKMKTVMAEDKYIFNNYIFNNELTSDKRKYFVL